MLNKNGQKQLVATDATIPYVEEPPTDVSLARAPQEGNILDPTLQSGPWIFVHAPQIHWHQVMVASCDEKSHGRLVTLEKLVHQFGPRMEAWEDYWQIG